MSLKYLIILVIFKILQVCVCTNFEANNRYEDHNMTQLERAKRGLGWPWLLYGLNAATGILVALAIPLHDLDRNVFLSYNFEANYNMPNIPSDSVPGPFLRWKLGSTYEDMSVNSAGDATQDDIIAREFGKGNETIGEEVETETTTFKDTIKNSLEEEKFSSADHDEHNEIYKRSIIDKMVLTRKGVYRVLESRISANGLDGKKCLLRAICESAANSFLDANGILGHILHIILTPSTSMDEHLPSEYSKAEKLGYKNDCKKYVRKCDFSLLDAVSTFV